jgi:serine/threonine protein kinase
VWWWWLLLFFVDLVGSFASVYAAQHIETGARVAIKIVDLQRLKAINTKLMTHLESEIKVMRELQHRNIVRLYDIAMDERHLFMIMEMCHYGDMAKYVQAQPSARLSEQRARFFMMQVSFCDVAGARRRLSFCLIVRSTTAGIFFSRSLSHWLFGVVV